MNIINVAPFDELVSLINNLSDEKSKRILLSKAADVYGNGGKAHIVKLTGITYPTLIAGKADSETIQLFPAAGSAGKELAVSQQQKPTPTSQKPSKK